MKNIEVKILNHSLNGMPIFLAKLTQRGHLINSMADLIDLYTANIDKCPSYQLLELPHTTISRMCELTVAIYGLSTKAVSQLRTHATRLTFISTSTQYSAYDNCKNPYVVPSDIDQTTYLKAINNIHKAYSDILKNTDKDSASYLLPQSLRKCLIIHGNFPAWQYVLKTRLCNRNTKEVQYICQLILQQIQDTCGKVWADLCLPNCVKAKCPEGKFCCGHNYIDIRTEKKSNENNN